MTAMLREVIGDELRRTRRSQGRTLRNVADSAQVSLGYLSEVERGRKEASSELLAAICASLGVAVSTLLTGVGAALAHLEDETGAVGIDAATKVVIPSAPGLTTTS